MFFYNVYTSTVCFLSRLSRQLGYFLNDSSERKIKLSDTLFKCRKLLNEYNALLQQTVVCIYFVLQNDSNVCVQVINARHAGD